MGIDFFQVDLFKWPKYLLLLTPATAVHCSASVLALLSPSTNWGHTNLHLLYVGDTLTIDKNLIKLYSVIQTIPLKGTVYHISHLSSKLVVPLDLCPLANLQYLQRIISQFQDSNVFKVLHIAPVIPKPSELCSLRTCLQSRNDVLCFLFSNKSGNKKFALLIPICTSTATQVLTD